MTVYKEFSFGGNQRPMGNFGPIIGLILFLVLAYFVIKGLFTVLAIAAPFLLLLAAILDYTVIIDYAKFIFKMLKENPIFGLVAIVTAIAYIAVVVIVVIPAVAIIRIVAVPGPVRVVVVVVERPWIVPGVVRIVATTPAPTAPYRAYTPRIPTVPALGTIPSAPAPVVIVAVGVDAVAREEIRVVVIQVDKERVIVINDTCRAVKTSNTGRILISIFIVFVVVIVVVISTCNVSWFPVPVVVAVIRRNAWSRRVRSRVVIQVILRLSRSIQPHGAERQENPKQRLIFLFHDAECFFASVPVRKFYRVKNITFAHFFWLMWL